jgi:hypothetical protein
MRAMFVSAALFNWTAAIVFVFASDWVLALLSLESSPTALLFLHLFFTVVFLFGIAYYRAATDLEGQAEVIKLGGAAKLALFVVATLDVALGVVSWPILVPLSGDLVYGLLFFKALSRLPKPATG